MKTNKRNMVVGLLVIVVGSVALNVALAQLDMNWSLRMAISLIGGGALGWKIADWFPPYGPTRW